jgi:hypothetical protein
MEIYIRIHCIPKTRIYLVVAVIVWVFCRSKWLPRKKFSITPGLHHVRKDPRAKMHIVCINIYIIYFVFT